MNDLTKQLKDLSLSLKIFFTKHRVTIFIIVASVTLSVMLIDISSMSNAEPSQAQISEAERSVKVITFDQDSLKVIDSLKGQDITIEALFDPGRTDPFSD